MGVSDGILVINKPLGITSHDVVAKVRKTLGIRKVGHAGTLDPEASGVLVLGVNRGTRLMQYFVGDNKRYEAKIRLGVATISDDAAGEVISVTPNSLTVEQITVELNNFVGSIMQRPSSVSAIKVNGTRAHDLVRAGVELVLPERPVTVHQIELTGINGVTYSEKPITEISVKVHCSSGTYVRALARDLGAALKVGGSVLSLKRTQAGVFNLADAIELADLTIDAKLLSPGDVAKRIMNVQVINSAHILDLAHGRSILLPTPDTNPLALLDEAGNLISIGELSNGIFQPVNVFVTPVELLDV
ncbi:MAG: tRNA pseudouridine(55) synthase TruB [Actinobacteria bacterium]|jgi:tRNA pseudouridine55 synthase|uniref:tRNA pseudouridine(55) synthase n=1 Tax=freshwater metagenome TaxID=449393 RepID=A0A6J6F8H2_9ZZZZ|nr:tRNA pseudouridine(55) synthase TruB [Actinomycetota bacterium]